MTSDAQPLTYRSFVDDLLSRAPQWMERVVQQAGERLDRGAASWHDLPPLAVGEAAQSLRVHAPELVQAFVRQLREELVAQPSDFLKLDTTPSTSPDLLPLRLMDEAQADEDIEIMRGVQLMDGEAEWELRELQARTSTLKGSGAVDQASNPLRPQALLRAWGQALKNVDLRPGARKALLRAVVSPMATALRQAARDSAKWLDSQGVQAAGYRIVSPAAPRGAPAAESGYDLTRPGALHEFLQVAAVAPARSAQPTPGFASLSDPGALEVTLDGLLRRLGAGELGPCVDPASGQPVNFIRRQEERLRTLAQGDGERRVIAVMAQLFDSLFADGLVPASAKRLISRLQASALRVALHDPDLFNRHDHPTWALINALGSHTMGYEEGDPRLELFVAAVATDFVTIERAPAPDAALHAAALMQLQERITESIVLEQRAASDTLARLEARESRLVMRQLYQEQVAQKLEGLSLGEPLHQFLTQDWVNVLVESSWPGYAGPVSAQDYWETLKTLVETLRPVADPASRTALLAQVPAMIGRLRQGMTLVGVAETRQQAVMDALMAAHQQLLKAAKAGEAVSRTGAEMSAQDIVRQMREESDSQWGTWGVAGAADSLMDVATLDTIPAGLEPKEGGSAEWTRKLVLGAWLRVFNRGDWAPLRLLWRSRSGQYLLFGTPLVDHPLSMTQRALERLAHEQLARPLEARSLFERAVDSMMGTA
jgi:hypothetical protein